VKPHASRAGKVWTWAAISGVVVLLWLAFQIRVPGPPEAARPANPPSVRLVDPVVTAWTMLLDPTPLFLPTEFNSSRIDYVPREPGGSFAGFPFKKTFSDTELELHLPPATDVPASPADALAGDPPGAPFIGFDRADPVVEPLSPRGAYVDIMDAGTGRSVLALALADAHPPASMPWQPMEFIAAVDAAGLVGPVVPTNSSGVDDVDTYFGRYLADTLRVGQRLAPGFYRIVVGP
jgi:hypothetical protein